MTRKKITQDEAISESYFGSGIMRIFRSFGFWTILISILCALYVGKYVAPTWSVEKVSIDVQTNEKGELYYTYKKKPKVIPQVVEYSRSELNENLIYQLNMRGPSPNVNEEYVYEVSAGGQDDGVNYYLLKAKKHWGAWSLLPALAAIVLCWVVKEPITALLGGIITGSFMLGMYDVTDLVIIPRLMSKGAASVLVLYLILLGALLGIWSRTGAAKAFAEYMAKNFVTGPRSAKLVAWFLGIVFHQGGTMSTVLVGTTVKPLSDEEKISHEELSYIVDSTASPIAALLPFNAWPGYVQSFIYVSGVAFLATEADRFLFFIKSVPLSFYCILAVLFTFLMSIDRLPFMGQQFKDAVKRSRETGELDAVDAHSLEETQSMNVVHVPKGYTPHIMEFVIPILLIIGISIGTFIVMSSPKIRWGFGAAVVVAWAMALMRGMSLKHLMSGLEEGLKSVVTGAVILLLAMTIGGISKDAGGGIYLVELLGSSIPYWLLPVILQLMTMVISFSTGTSWGTYAVAFPLAMPLAIAVAASQGLAHPEFYTLICFTTVLNGSVYGDQCSPISDTTVLSAMVTGCRLMDHVRTQIYPATVAAGIAAVLWTVLAVFAA